MTLLYYVNMALNKKNIFLFSLFPALILIGVFVLFSKNKTIIQVTDDGFVPKEITIKQGDIVVFKNVSEESHWPASNIHPTHRLYPISDIEKCETNSEKDVFDACKPIEQGGTYSFTFKHVGVWRFHDHINPQFTGKITVLADEGAGKKDTNIAFVRSSFEREFNEYIQEDSEEIFHNRDALYSYVKKFGPKETTRQLHDLTPKFGDCHQSAHDAGNFAYEVHGAKAFQLCSAECHSGCYHGATEMYFRDHGTSNLAEDLKVICDSELNPFFSHQCIHGVGHGLMAWADYDIFDALENCDLLPFEQASCYTGVYMENIVGGLAQEQGHFTQFLNDDPHFPCNIVDEKYKASCYFSQTSRMIQIFHGDFKKVAASCAEIEAMYQLSCFKSMGRDVGGRNYNNPEGAVHGCINVLEKGQRRTWCLTGAVQNYFWDPNGQDNALRFCKILEESREKEACYNTIFSRASQILFTKEETKSFCLKAEEGFWDTCLELGTI